MGGEGYREKDRKERVRDGRGGGTERKTGRRG